MNDIEKKALALLNEVCLEMGLHKVQSLELDIPGERALLRAIEQHEAADRIEALEAGVAELKDIAGDLLTRFEPWSPHDHDAAKRASAVLGRYGR